MVEVLGKIVLHGDAAREALIRGVDFLCDAVKVTLGPKGRLVVMGRRGVQQSPAVTKDGVTVANSIDPKDPFEQLGSDLVRECAQKTVENSGDGTTTSCVLAQAMIHAGNEQLKAGISPAELIKGIRKAVDEVVLALGELAQPVTDEQLAQVAAISANGDECIGKLVQAAILKVGKDGVMTCEESRSVETSLDVVDGMQIRQGYRSPYFINDQERAECSFDNALIFMYEGKLGAAKSLVNILKMAVDQGRPLLVIAGDYEPEALNIFVVNKVKGGMPVCAIRADGWGPRRREILQDIAVLTGGVALTEDVGMKVENFDSMMFGKAKRIIVTEFRTTIIQGAGDDFHIKVRADEIRQAMAKEEQPTAKALLQQRLSGLTGGIAVIKVGGNTEAEMKELKDRVEDALFSTKAAAEEGIVAGGGLALCAAAQRVFPSLNCPVIGEALVHACIAAPMHQILRNAGLEYRMADFRKAQGLNVATGEFCDLIAGGILDPVKVVREALVNAASVACTILQAETLIAEVFEK